MFRASASYIFEKTIFISKDELDISNFRDTSKLIRNLNQIL